MISFIIPSYNRKKYLEELLNSISNITIEYEIVIIDDNSTDDTTSLVNDFKKIYPIKYYKNKINKGPAYNRKLGFEISTGDYLIFADDDDYYTNANLFKLAYNTLEENKHLSFYSFHAKIKIENQLSNFPLNMNGEIDKFEYLNKFQVSLRKPLSTFTTVFRKSSLINSGIELFNDSSIYLRSLLIGNAYIDERYIGVYRMHQNNITINLNVDFIIVNIKEKNKIYKESKKLKINLNKNWLNEQIEITVNYLLDNNKINTINRIKLYKNLLLNGAYKLIIKNLKKNKYWK